MATGMGAGVGTGVVPRVGSHTGAGVGALTEFVAPVWVLESAPEVGTAGAQAREPPPSIYILGEEDGSARLRSPLPGGTGEVLGSHLPGARCPGRGGSQTLQGKI
jgi:hypothetical protein